MKKSKYTPTNYELNAEIALEKALEDLKLAYRCLNEIYYNTDEAHRPPQRAVSDIRSALDYTNDTYDLLMKMRGDRQ